MFEAKSVFEKSPTIRISYLAGALQALTLAIPLTIHKFMEATDLTGDDFFKRWKKIGGAPREAQKVFGLKSTRGDREITGAFVKSVVEGFKWGILEGVDPNKRNFVGAGVLHTNEGNKAGCLLRLEPNYETKMYRLTIRATDEKVPPVLLKLMADKLTLGTSTRPEKIEPPSRREINDTFANVLVRQET